MSGYGFVYVLTSPAMPGLYKVGATTRSPRQRAEELSRGTGVPHEFEVAFYAEVQEPFLWERRVHALLSDKRISSSREFFYGPLIDIIHTIEGDGECLSYWDSDQATEARNPGMVWPARPLWFEQNLHSAGYLERLRRNAQ